MPRHLWIAGVAAAALTLAACNQQGEQQDAGAPAAMPDANPAATIPTPADETAAPDFVQKAAASNMFEIQSSQLALEKSQNSEVRQFAQQMIDDHTQAGDQLQTAIAQSGLALTPPTTLPDDMRSTIEELRQASAQDFDRRYIEEQVEAHQNALNLMARYAEAGEVPALKQFAAQTGPIIQRHYDRAVALRDQLQTQGGQAPTQQ